MASPPWTAVGGTELSYSGSGYSETVWDGAGSGCTTRVQKAEMAKRSELHGPHVCRCFSGRRRASPNTTRTVAAVGSPVSGTSVATPLIAGVYGLAGNAKTQHGPKSLWILKKGALKKSLHYISTGSNGSCGGSYLCTAGTNQFGTYSGPSGFGTPNGIGAF